MAQLVTAILSHHEDLTVAARRITDDTNEASLLVGKVLTRAFTKFDRDTSPEALSRALRYDLDKLIAARRFS